MDIGALDALTIVLDPLSQAGLAAALALMMFSVALALSVDDFVYLIQRPLLFAGGVAAQVIGLPLITLVLVSLIAPPPSIALGMLVVACCPGGTASNFLTYLARGNVAFSVALTGTSSLLAALITPLSILFWSQAYAPTADLLQRIDFSPLAFLSQLTVLLAAPIVIGMLIAARAPDVAQRIRRRLALLAALVLGGVIVFGLIRFYPVLAPALPFLAAVGILHNAVAFATGFAVGTLLRADFRSRRTLVFEIGIQNAGLALVILIGQLQGVGGAAAIVAFWGVWHLLAGGFIVVILRLLDRARAGDDV